MKRSYEDVFGQDNAPGDVLGEVSFKFMNHLNILKGGFVPTQCGQAFGRSNCREIDYHAYLNMEECALLAEAHAIEKRKDEAIPQPPIELREIKRVKRKGAVPIQQNPVVDPPEDLAVDPQLQAVDLEDKGLEKIEIEYLEKLSADCKLPITKEKAFVMKKYTDLLLNAVTSEKTVELKRVKAENIVLKRAFKLQNDVVTKTRLGCTELKTENLKLQQGLDQALYENRLLVAKIRELQIQELSGQNHSSNPAFGWGGGDIAGF